jgi:hypothetical protein
VRPRSPHRGQYRLVPHGFTEQRFQIVIEGTTSPNPEPGDWQEYEFKGQPVKLDERPPQWAPYHLRLDWQLWFAAMSPSPRRHPWFERLLDGLQDGDEATLSLLEASPFEEPPQQVRAIRYRYRFTTPAEREESGRWWRRERVGIYARARPGRSPDDNRYYSSD